ncbi:MAG: O-antigen ligase domain-containing protein [Comamonadaceae bacterium]|nr:MAG: O-antigen ligase domain-containing protein [Comamonadaceae bacterium]
MSGPRDGGYQGAGLAPVSNLAFAMGCAMLVFVSIIRGGNRQVALIVLEWLGLLVCVLLLARWALRPTSAVTPSPGDNAAGKRRASFPVLFLALAPVWFALLQLTPIPAGLWTALPGHSAYAAAVAAVGSEAMAFRSISLQPDATVASLLAGIPVAAAFLLAWFATGQQVATVVRLFIIVALVQAMLALMQASEAFAWLQFGAEGKPKGTFGNSNHYANFLAMAIPLAWLKFRADPSRAARRQDRMGAKTMWIVVVFVLMAGVVVSMSRTGIATALLVMFGAAALVGKKSADKGQWQRYLLAVAAIAGLALLLVAPDFWATRIADRAGSDVGVRWQVYASTWDAAWQFFPFGSGLGSYGGVFARFKPATRDEYFEYAHNDYLQLLMEGGLLGVVLLAVLAWLLVRKCLELARAARQDEDLPFDLLLRIALGLSLLALLLHSAVDFNTHIPANAMVGAFIAGAFLRPAEARRRGIRRSSSTSLKSGSGEMLGQGDL